MGSTGLRPLPWRFEALLRTVLGWLRGFSLSWLELINF